MLAEPLVNIGSAAALYSQIAGVLAGFAFTGLLLYLNRAPDSATASPNTTGESPSVETQPSDQANENAHGGVTVVLFTTLGALIICAVLYGELAGGGAAEGNSFSGLLLNGPAFGGAIIGIFYATALAATPFAYLSAMLSAARILVGIIGPSISMLLIVLAATDIDVSRCTVKHGGTAEAHNACLRNTHLAVSQSYGLGLLLTGVLLTASLVLWGTLRKPKGPAPASVANTMAVLIMAPALAAVILTGYLSGKAADYLLPDSVVRVILSATFIILLVQSILVMRTCHYIPTIVNKSPQSKPRQQVVSQQQNGERVEGIPSGGDSGTTVIGQADSAL